MWTILVFSTDRRRPIGRSTAATSSCKPSAWVRVPDTRTTLSRAGARRWPFGPARFPGPLAEPDVRLSPHPALHEFMRRVTRSILMSRSSTAKG